MHHMQDATLAKYYTLNAQIFNTLTLSAQRVAAVANGTVNGTASDIDQVRCCCNLHLPMQRICISGQD